MSVATRAAITAAALALVPAVAFSIQLEAPSVNVVSPALLDRVWSPGVVSGAFDWPYEDRGEGLAFTLRGTPFFWLADSAVTDSPRLTMREPMMSRLGAAFTLGGPTQTDDQVMESRHHRVSDHVTAELKLPIMGALAESSESAAAIHTDSPVALGVALGADIYSTGFGRDLYTATLVAESTRALPWVANFGFRAEEKVNGQRDDEVKLGVGSGATWPQPFWVLPAIQASASAAVLLRNREREDVWLANTRLDLPFRGRVRAIGAVTWSNAPERIRVEVVRARLGLGYEFIARR